MVTIVKERTYYCISIHHKIRKVPFLLRTKTLLQFFFQGGNFHDKTGIRILTICFGPTETALMERLEEKLWDERSVHEFLETTAETQRYLLIFNKLTLNFLTCFVKLLDC